MRIIIYTIICISMFCTNVYATHDTTLQRVRPFRYWTIASNLTYIWNIEAYQYRYNEWTWTSRIATDLSRRVRVGGEYKYIWTANSWGDHRQYQLMGGWGQFNLLPKRRTRLVAEVGAGVSNYCTCGAGDPYRIEPTPFYSLGGALHLPIRWGLWLDLGFNVYTLVARYPERYAYTQYTIGLQYRLDLRRWRKT